MQKVKFKPKKKGRVGQFLRRFAEIVIAGGPHYIQPLCTVRTDKKPEDFSILPVKNTMDKFLKRVDSDTQEGPISPKSIRITLSKTRK